MWRFQTYGTLFAMIIYGVLVMNGIVEGSRRMSSGGIAIGIGLFALGWVVFYFEPMIRKEKRDAQKKKEKDEL